MRVLWRHDSRYGQGVVKGGRAMVMLSDWAFDGCCPVSDLRADRTKDLDSETTA